MTSFSRRTVPAVAVAALVLAACGSSATDDPSEADPDAGSGPTVVASTTIWADIVTNVACNGLAQVDTVIPPGGDPHSFEPSLRDRERMEDAVLVVANGLDLEESLADTIDAVEANGVRVLRVADGLDTISFADDDPDHAEDDADHADDDHGHDGDDPHVWWDPTLVAAAVPTIADELAAAGIDRAALDACASDYIEVLTDLDAEVAAVVAPLPPDSRVLVTNHDSMSYFAARYDFEVLGSVIPSSSSLAAASPSELDDLATAIEAAGVPAVFAETQQSSNDIDALANRIGDIDVVDLLTDTLGEPGGGSDTYVEWLRTNVVTIVDALTPANR